MGANRADATRVLQHARQVRLPAETGGRKACKLSADAGKQRGANSMPDGLIACRQQAAGSEEGVEQSSNSLDMVASRVLLF